MSGSELKKEFPSYFPIVYMDVCPNCFKTFSGRKNKKFCSSRCKSLLNNSKASVKRERIAKDVNIYSSNESFLNDHYVDNQDITRISISLAKENGFDFTGPYMNVKEEFDGSRWYAIGNFEYQVPARSD
jgi:endogenous inhibitor of DNA gyrase (YacG/DUF329 family)